MTYFKDLVAAAQKRHHRKLKTSPKRKQQKYLVLLSNQVVIIGSEWTAMKEATRTGKTIIDMLPTDARVNDQTTVLTKLLESLEIKK